MIRVLELFGGIGAFTQAMKRLNLPIEVVDYVEIDKYAVASYNAMNGTQFECQDIRKYSRGGRHDVDIIMHGSPCQDFSLAGKGKGGDEGSGTRSSLMYETIRIVSEEMPKVVIWENVKALLSAKHRHNFDSYLERLEELGYKNYYRVLNAKDYGIPQNRERIFTISILGDHKPLSFPSGFPIETRLIDLLEKEVPESFYIAEEKLEKLLTRDIYKKHSDVCKESKCIQVGNLYGTEVEPREDDLCNTLTHVQKDNYIAITEPFIAAERGRNPEKPSDRTAGVHTEQRLEPNTQGLCNTLTSVQKDNLLCESIAGLRVRKLTPRECWRLMGFSDEVFEKAENVNSNTQLYKQAGNSIVVNVLVEIIKQLMKSVDFGMPEIKKSVKVKVRKVKK